MCWHHAQLLMLMHMHMHMHMQHASAHAHAHAHAHAAHAAHAHAHHSACTYHICVCACKAKLQRLQRLGHSRHEGAKATKAKRSTRMRELAGTQPEALPPPTDVQAKLKALPPWAGLPTQGVLEFVYAHVQLLPAVADGAATAGGGASAPSRPALKRPPLKRPTAAVAAPVTPLMGDDDLAQVLRQALALNLALISKPCPSP